MLTMLITGLVVVLILGAMIIIIHNHPDFWFWIFLNLFFDPGGYAYGLLGVRILGPLHITDVCISGIVICLISAKVNWKNLFYDKQLKKFFIAFIIFGGYYFIFYGGIVPSLHNDLNYSNFLLKNRLFMYALILLVSVYVFAFRGLYYYYTSTLIIGFICLNLFLITLVTGVNLIPVVEAPRHVGEDIMRIGMLSHGLFYAIFPISLITYILSHKIVINLKLKTLLYYCGVVLIITLLIALTKRTQIDLIGSVILVSFIIAYIFRMGKLSAIIKVIAPAVVVFIVLYFTLPDYTGYIAETAEDTFLLMTTGRDSRGEIDQRVSGTDDYILVLEYIKNNLVLGVGHTHLYWRGPGDVMSSRGKEFAVIRDAAGEVPIYLLFFEFGLAGAILMLPLYYLMGKFFFKLITLLRRMVIKFLQEPLIIIISIYVLLSIAVRFTLNFYTLGSGFIAPDIAFTSVLMGMGFAIKFKMVLLEKDKYISPDSSINEIKK